MKKMIFALMCMVGCITAFADEAVESDNIVTNVYNFKMSIKVPYLKAGVRTYAGRTFKGYLFAEYVDNELSSMWIEHQNTKTKVTHITTLNADENFYHLIGKTTKTAVRSVPSVYFAGLDEEIFATKEEAHELITQIQLSGNGTIKNVQTVKGSCSACCGITTPSTYCNILYKMNGHVTGVMDCQCPDDDPSWLHTVQTILCGPAYDSNNDVIRDHRAAIHGTWSASFNSKLSGTKIK